MKNTKIFGVIRYIDEEQGFAIIRTEIGNFIVDATELKSIGIKWKTCFPDLSLELTLSQEPNLQIAISLKSKEVGAKSRSIRARLESESAA